MKFPELITVKRKRSLGLLFVVDGAVAVALTRPPLPQPWSVMCLALALLLAYGAPAVCQVIVKQSIVRAVLSKSRVGKEKAAFVRIWSDGPISEVKH